MFKKSREKYAALSSTLWRSPVARPNLEDFIHAPVLADAVVDAGQSVFGAGSEEEREFALNLGPGLLLDNAAVHDVELLLLAVGGACWVRYSAQWLNVDGLALLMAFAGGVGDSEGAVGVIGGGGGVGIHVP